MLTKTKASQRSKGEGKRIRRARNIVKRWQALNGSEPPFPGTWQHEHVAVLVKQKRYERAVAVLVRAALLGE